MIAEVVPIIIECWAPHWSSGPIMVVSLRAELRLLMFLGAGWSPVAGLVVPGV